MDKKIILITILLVGLMTMVGCNFGEKRVADPVFYPEGGSYEVDEDFFPVEIESGTRGADIYYTINGDLPDDESTLYQRPILLTQNAVVRAIAYKEGMLPSNIVREDYDLAFYMDEPEYFCDDNETEIDPFFKGTLKYANEETDGEAIIQEDSCITIYSGEHVMDFYCSGEDVRDTLILCVNGCEDGACIRESSENCTDSDGGRDYYTKGFVGGSSIPEEILPYDRCVFDGKTGKNSTVEELFCEENNLRAILYDCPNDCEDGACIEELEPGNEVLFEDVELNAGWWEPALITPMDLPFLRESSIDFNDNDYEYHEELLLGPNALTLMTSKHEEDFGRKPYMTTTANEIRFMASFDDKVPWSEVGEPGSDKYVEFFLLGKQMKIVDVLDENSFILEAGQDVYLEEGDYVTIDGHVVKLEQVGANSVRVSVDGQIEVISGGQSEAFEDAGDYEVEARDIFYIEGEPDNGANLLLGQNLQYVVTSGASAEFFGEPSDEDEADWLWEVQISENFAGSTGGHIGIMNNIDRFDLGANDPDERNALAEGESLFLPNGYLQIQFTDWYAKDLSEGTQYLELYVDIDDSIDLSDGVQERFDVGGYEFSIGSTQNVFNVKGVETNKVWAISNNGYLEIWYKDGDYETRTNATSFFLQRWTDKIEITPPANPSKDLTQFSPYYENGINFEFPHTNDTIVLFGDVDNDYFGMYDEEEWEELYYIFVSDMYIPYNNIETPTGIGAVDYDYLTDYGVLIFQPEYQFSSGSSFSMAIPEGQLVGLITIKSGTEASGQSGAGGISTS